MKQDSVRSRTNFAAFILLGVFSLSVALTLLGGAAAYRRLLARSQLSYERRTTSQYFAGKLHQAPGAVHTDRFGDGDALVIPQTIDGAAYETRIYCHDGWLMELFTLSGSGLMPADGEKILPIQDLTLLPGSGILEIRWADSTGQSQQLIAELPAGSEVAP